MIYNFHVIVVQLFIVYNSVMLETVRLSAPRRDSLDCLKIARLNFSVQIVHEIIDRNDVRADVRKRFTSY